MTSSLPEHLAGLLQPQAYPHPVEAITLVETHISWVLLTGRFAYKVKRPVHFPFVDLSSLERRAFCCAEEVRLNRRFAPDLYLEARPITVIDGAVHMGGSGEPIEHAVKMLQFRRDEELDTLLAKASITPAELTAFGQDLATIHAGLPVAEPPSTWGDPQAIRAMIAKNLEECAQASVVFDYASEVSSLRPELEHHLEALAPLMAERRAGGRIRECHGDLHAANIVRRDARLVAFDCIEFEPAFRWIDVAEEIAFLLADLDARGHPKHEQALLGGYLTRSGDFQACRLVSLYKAHRALVRAKVTALSRAGASPDAGQGPTGLALHRAYIDCAKRALARRYPTLILMSGLSGSGKSWLAERLAPLLGAVHLRSDVERKRLAGLNELERSNSALGEGMYSRAATTRLYECLASNAEDVLLGGYSAIVDATFARREDRSILRQLSHRLGVSARLIECVAPHNVLVNRIMERDSQKHDASEADVSVLNWQREHWEPVAADELWEVMGTDTTSPDLEDLARRIRIRQPQG
jgi:aminoglycoside phosphotransferase family enzyme/predicted kinase